MDRLYSLLQTPPVDPGIIAFALIGAAMVAVAAAVIATRSALAGRNEVVERLERTIGQDTTPSPDARPPEAKKGFQMGKLFGRIAWIARPTKAAELSRLRLRLVQGGYRGPYALETFLALKLLFAVGAILTYLQVHGAFLADRLPFAVAMALGVWICGGAFLAPNFWLGSRIKDRQGKIERALPDGMDLLVTCVEAGLGIDAAISRVSEEIGIASPMLGSELNLTFLEVQAGVSRPDAFRRLAERTGVEDLRALSAMLIQTEMFGTSVARALRVHSDGMRIKRMQRAEEKAAMVGVKMTLPLILLILPSLVAILVGPAIAAIVNGLFQKIGGP